MENKKFNLLGRLLGKPRKPVTTKNFPIDEKKIIHQPRIPIHFQNNAIVTYSKKEIELELVKYPGLLKTLSHAYEYQIIVISNDNQQTDYWFCRSLQYSLDLLKYLNSNENWIVDWHEKPFTLIC